LYQLKDFERGDLNAGKTAITGLAFAQAWSLDATGNWTAFKEDTDGNGGWDLNQSRSHNNVNEIGTIGASAGPDWVDPIHDRAGNMVLIPQPADPTQSFVATWDAWNRLVKLMDGVSTVDEYAYDGLFRRTNKTLSGVVRHFYYSALWQVLEERLGASSLADRQFVWGLRYIDNLVVRDRDTSAPPDGMLDERLYALQDGAWNVTAIVDESGSTRERYVHAPYGAMVVFDGSFNARGASIYDWQHGFAAYTVDDTGLLIARRRYLAPNIGRWLQRDALTYLDGPNLYEFALSSPVSVLDPFGTTTGGLRGPLPAGMPAVVTAAYQNDCHPNCTAAYRCCLNTSLGEDECDKLLEDCRNYCNAQEALSSALAEENGGDLKNWVFTIGGVALLVVGSQEAAIGKIAGALRISSGLARGLVLGLGGLSTLGGLVGFSGTVGAARRKTNKLTVEKEWKTWIEREFDPVKRGNARGASGTLGAGTFSGELFGGRGKAWSKAHGFWITPCSEDQKTVIAYFNYGGQWDQVEIKASKTIGNQTCFFPDEIFRINMCLQCENEQNAAKGQ
ncbi:MAG: RHS repeat-associated core domain-containing protein, partial [Pirellulales bacterium]